MPLWKLEPIDLTDRNWEASTYRDEVIIRAENLQRAELFAARAYGIATKQKFAETVKLVPWVHSGFVRATQVEATDDYAEDGDQAIVYPREAVTSAHHGYNAE